jgi:hypothetical protein
VGFHAEDSDGLARYWDVNIAQRNPWTLLFQRCGQVAWMVVHSLIAVAGEAITVRGNFVEGAAKIGAAFK